MENSNVKLTPQEVFNNQKLFSNKILIRVLKTIEDIFESFYKFEIEEDDDKRAFINAINHHYHDLCAVIFDLRQVVIKIDGDDQNIISNFITELNKIAFSVQESLHLETEELKTHLEGTFKHLGSHVEKLTKIIECDNLQEEKQKLLDIQLDLLISAGAIKLYIKNAFITIPELEEIIHEVVEKIRTNLIQIKSDHEHLIEDFSHYTRHSIQYIQSKIDYMRKMRNTENFQGDLAKAFKLWETMSDEIMHELLEAVYYDNPMKKMLDTIDSFQAKVSKIVVKVQDEVQPNIEKCIGNIDDNKTVHQVINYLFLGGLNGLQTLNQCIEDAIMKK